MGVGCATTRAGAQGRANFLWECDSPIKVALKGSAKANFKVVELGAEGAVEVTFKYKAVNLTTDIYASWNISIKKETTYWRREVGKLAWHLDPAHKAANPHTVDVPWPTLPPL